MHSLNHVLNVSGSEPLARNDFHADAVQFFLDDLALTNVRLIDKDPVKTHHTASIAADHDVFDAPDDFFHDGHRATAFTGAIIPSGDVTEAITALKQMARKGDVILLKASRVTGLERVSEGLE